MQQYDFNQAKFGTHKLVAEEITHGQCVLDVGCNKGYMKKVAPDARFYGIDYDASDLEIARNENGYEEVFAMDLNNYTQFRLDKKFEVIIFADILEHLVHPEEVLRYFVCNYLKKGGTILISLPNVANFSIRIQLMTGNFDYAESGILDMTHLHLYTRSTAKKLIHAGGLEVQKEKFSSNNFGAIIKYLPVLGGLLGYNLIFVCKAKS